MRREPRLIVGRNANRFLIRRLPYNLHLGHLDAQDLVIPECECLKHFDTSWGRRRTQRASLIERLDTFNGSHGELIEVCSQLLTSRAIIHASIPISRMIIRLGH